MNFDKNGIVRQARTSNKAQFDAAPSMARTRENAGEFGRAATAGKLLRQTLRKQIQGAADRLMVSRMTKAMRAVEALDATNLRGKRQVLKANVAELVGFDFNSEAPLSAVVFAAYAVTISAAGLIKLTLPGLVPNVDLAAPVGTTHYGLEVGVAVLNFEANTGYAMVPAGVPGVAALDGTAVGQIAVTAALPAVPGPTEVVVVVLGVNFFQQINGQFYPLNNGGTNPLGVVYCG